MLNIRIKTIPHREQRYRTCGDYWNKKDRLEIRVSNLNDKTYELAIALHELYEQHLAELAGVSVDEIDKFDIAYENARDAKRPSPCGCEVKEEPGDDPHAPYYDFHQLANKIERQFIGDAMWASYNKRVNML